MCFYCENGLPERVKAIFDELEREHPNADSGPGHIVFSDFNLGTGNIEFCLERVGAALRGEETYEFRTMEDIEADGRALRALLDIPEAERDPAPADYE